MASCLDIVQPFADHTQIYGEWYSRFSLRFRGFIDLIGAEGDAVQQLLTQPQLLVDVGSGLGCEGRLWAGVEYQFWKNKYGIDGVDESFVQLKIMWEFQAR